MWPFEKEVIPKFEKYDEEVDVERGVVTLYFVDGVSITYTVFGTAASQFIYGGILCGGTWHNKLSFDGDASCIKRLLRLIGKDVGYINPDHIIRATLTNIEPHFVKATRYKEIK